MLKIKMSTPDLTPVEQRGKFLLKRDDFFSVGGVNGGKVRTCLHLAQGAAGLVTAGSRESPQCNIVASIAKHLNIPCQVHTPSGKLGAEVENAARKGADVIQHLPGYNTVIVARARAAALQLGWKEIPFGMECRDAVNATSSQVANIPPDVNRIVMPVGSGMSLSGVLAGLRRRKLNIPVLGVVVGASPEKRLNAYAPKGWQSMVTLVNAGCDYHKHITAYIEGVQLDPIYEAKCSRFMQDGDLLWIVGVRESMNTKPMSNVMSGEHKVGERKMKASGQPQINNLFGRPEENGGIESQTGTSIFDPVLCELAYSWFSPQGGTVLDPFAGGSVRGIVASHLGRQYIGVELRQEQVEANRLQGDELCPNLPPVWHTGDSRNIDKICADVDADFIFSCPPYADLEVYSDDPNDLSTLKYEDFKAAYFDIIAKTCSRLKDNRFACFVVGDVRDKKGNYYNFVGDTVEAFRAAGLHYYNEAILVTAVGSLPIRAGRYFVSGRKLGKTHQNVLVFVKGDGKKATQACGDIEVYMPDNGDEERTDLSEKV